MTQTEPGNYTITPYWQPTSPQIQSLIALAGAFRACLLERRARVKRRRLGDDRDRVLAAGLSSEIAKAKP